MPNLPVREAGKCNLLTFKKIGISPAKWIYPGKTKNYNSGHGKYKSNGKLQASRENKAGELSFIEERGELGGAVTKSTTEEMSWKCRGFSLAGL